MGGGRLLPHFARFCRSLPGFARCVGEYARPTMPVQATKSERDWYVEAVDLQTGL